MRIPARFAPLLFGALLHVTAAYEAREHEVVVLARAELEDRRADPLERPRGTRKRLRRSSGGGASCRGIDDIDPPSTKH
mgnify:CR=1 FL=1